MVVDDETAPALVLLEEDRGSESADAAADRDEVVRLPGVDGGGDARFERAVAQRVPGAQHFPGIAVRVCIVADTTVAVEGVGRGDRRALAGQEHSGAGEERTVEEVAP